MQHHGAPTRLLDWTYSPFVAAYFALEALLSADVGDGRTAAIWAIRAGWVNDQVESILQRDGFKVALATFNAKRDATSFNSLFVDACPRIRFVYPVNPLLLNERLIIQQGVFLCPRDISISFEENLKKLLHGKAGDNVQKLCISRYALREALESLYRMNINRANLFPGLDGYAQSLKTRFPFFVNAEFDRDRSLPLCLEIF